MAVKRFSDGSSIKNSFKMSRGATSVAKPDAPTIGTATAVTSSTATVAYTAATLGAAGSTFTATSSPGSLTGTGASPITVSGLTSSTNYTFTVKASNANGDSPNSAASNQITIPEPSPVAGYTAWYDASDTATISLSGSDVTQWNDKSANGYHLTQSNSSYRPQSGTRTVNSKNVIDYNGNSDSLVASTNTNWAFMNNSTGSTMFIMLSIDATPVGDPYVIFRSNGGNTSTIGYSGLVTVNNKWHHSVCNGTGNVLENLSTNVGLSVTTPAIIVVKSDPSNATAANRSYIYKNSGSADQNNTTTGTPSSDNPTQPLRIGDYTSGGTLSLNGVIGEIVIYSGLLSDTDRTTTIDYLKTKWGI